VRKRLVERRLIEIVEMVAEQHHVLAREVLGPVRLKTYVAARHEVWRVIRERHGFSFPELGHLFERDPTSIRYGVQSAIERMVDGG